MSQKCPSHVPWETYVDAVTDRCREAIDSRWKSRFAQILLEEKARQILELTRINANLKRAFKVKNRKGTPGYRSWLWKFRHKNNPRLAALTVARVTA